MIQSTDFETDHRLPSGEWTGFFLDTRVDQRGWMHLYLNFQGGKIEGEGTDYVGPWQIKGQYDLDTGRCQWLKQYLQQHHVHYQGQCGRQGILGLWEIYSGISGEFHIWPKGQADVQELYLQQDLNPSLPRLSESLESSLFEDALQELTAVPARQR